MIEPGARPLALVTGASRGIGAAVAGALAPTHDVLLGGRDADALGAVAAGLPGARPWPVELTDPTELADAVADIDRLDVLVHSAGIGPLGTVEDSPAEQWRQTFEVNVVAVAELTRLLLPALRAARGRVVCINSGAGFTARPGWASYAASKFALRAFADALRAEEADPRRPCHVRPPRAHRHRHAARGRRPRGRRVRRQQVPAPGVRGQGRAPRRHRPARRGRHRAVDPSRPALTSEPVATVTGSPGR